MGCVKTGMALLFVMLALAASLVQAEPEPAGWYAGDMHVHRSCGGAAESLSSLRSKMAANDLLFISLLADMGNGEVQNPVTDLPKVGTDDPISTATRIVHWDAEWHWDATYTGYDHQALGGHLVLLGLTGAEQIWEEYTYPILDWARQQGAIGGFAHMQYLPDGFPTSLNCCIPIEYPVEVALGAADFISEDVNGSESAIEAYYKLLNNGFRPGLAAGTDYPCGVSELGSLLTYVQVSGTDVTYQDWIEGIAARRTVISRNGHNEFLNLTVDGTATPGDEIFLTGPATLPVTITWTADENLSGRIELVHNGVVVASQQAAVSSGAPATLNATVDIPASGWLAARRMSGSSHEVHTAAVFVTVNDAPARASQADAEFYVDWMDNLLARTAPGGAWSSFFTDSRDEARARYQEAREVYYQVAVEAGMQPAIPGITTTALSTGMMNVPYSAELAASGGTTPYSWSVVVGSLPPGLALDSSTGTISGIPSAMGTYGFTVEVADSGDPAQTARKDLAITVVAEDSLWSLWDDAATPSVLAENDTEAVELGMKFQSDTDGFITGVRFYKGSANTGEHVGSLWSRDGTRLAQVQFTGETASGWQHADFPEPVQITADTVYVVSYHTNVGRYSMDDGYFDSAYDNGPLHALADDEDGGNGVYQYGPGGFPADSYNASNYWVDVVFARSAGGGSPTLTGITVTPATPTITVGAQQPFSAQATYSDSSTQNVTTQVTWSSGTPSVATIGAGTGLATAVAAGQTQISATLAGVTGSAQLTVNSPPTGLVAAYAFNESTGSSVQDASGNGHTGTITGATRTADGRFGSALSFNGTSNWVTIPDADDLDLGQAMTISAWVKSSVLSGWRTIIMKERPDGLSYSLYAQDNGPRPAAYINTGSNDQRARGSAGLVADTWTHLAATYDGATLRLYVNGDQAGTRSVSGNMVASTLPLRIGGNAVWGEYFNGLIDEVRIYNRVLSPVEIQADRDTAIGTP